MGQNFAMTEMAFASKLTNPFGPSFEMSRVLWLIGNLPVVRILQKYDRVEYRGDWYSQYHKAEIVGCPGDGVRVAFHEAQKGDMA